MYRPGDTVSILTQDNSLSEGYLLVTHSHYVNFRATHTGIPGFSGGESLGCGPLANGVVSAYQAVQDKRSFIP
jgi:hypothetical protein